MSEKYKVRVTFTDLDGNDVSAVMLKSPALNMATCPGIEIVGEFGFEQVVSVPSKFGAVIRRADGKVFTHVPGRTGAMNGYDWFSRGNHWHTETATWGGFTVLFDGVDE